MSDTVTAVDWCFADVENHHRDDLMGLCHCLMNVLVLIS